MGILPSLLLLLFVLAYLRRRGVNGRRRMRRRRRGAVVVRLEAAILPARIALRLRRRRGLHLLLSLLRWLVLLLRRTRRYDLRIWRAVSAAIIAATRIAVAIG